MQSQDVPISFPTSGLNVSSEFGRQPADTCSSAQNVRVYDTFELRRRGGSRSGLIKLIEEMLNGASPIQHLAIIVDPTTPAIAADHDGVTEDTSTNNIRVRNPGRHVRPGGSGRPINRNIGDTASDTGIKFVQKKGSDFQLSNDPLPFPQTANLDSTPGNGHLLIVIVRAVSSDQVTTPTGSPPVVTVTNGDGDAYTLIENAENTYNITIPSSQIHWHSLSIWMKNSTGDPLDATVILNPGGAAFASVAIIEYRNNNIDSLNDSAQNIVLAQETPWTLGNINLASGSGQMAIGAFLPAPGIDEFGGTSDSPFTIRIDGGDYSPGNVGPYVVNAMNQTGPSTVNPNLTDNEAGSSTDIGYLAVGATFIPV